MCLSLSLQVSPNNTKGLLLEEVSRITLKHDEISTELYTGHVFPAYDPEVRPLYLLRVKIRSPFYF